jgi:sensor histidine kinase YesM
MGVSNIPSKLDSDKIGGLGLNNVYFRLQLIYNGLAHVEITSDKFVGTNILLSIPHECEENDSKM